MATDGKPTVHRGHQMHPDATVKPGTPVQVRVARVPGRTSHQDDRLSPAERKSFYTPGEVAKLFGVTAKTVSNWCDQGRLEFIATPSGHRRIPVSAIKGGREYDAKLRSLQGKLDVINAAVNPDDAPNSDGPEG